MVSSQTTKGCTRSTHSGGCEVVRFSFVPGERCRYHRFLHAMRPRFSIYSLLWLTLFAALASVFYVNYLWQAKALADVVVSARLLPHGHKITSEDVQLARVPIDNVPEGTATSLSKVLGNHIRNGYTKNHPIYLDNLYEIRVTTNYNWHDDSRIHLEKPLALGEAERQSPGKVSFWGFDTQLFMSVVLTEVPRSTLIYNCQIN